MKDFNNIFGKVKDSQTINLTLNIASINWFKSSRKNKYRIKKIAVINDKGNALLKNIFKPFFIFVLLSSWLNEIICLIECKKQK